MTKIAVEQFANAPAVAYASYDSTKLVLGPQIYQNTSSTPNFVGPIVPTVARPMEATVPIPILFPNVIQYSSTIDWVFGADISTAAATRRTVWYEYNKVANTYTWKGFITHTYPVATVHTIRGFRVTRDLYTTGTVAVSGTAVTGTGTAWSTARMCVGNRIGFGSTDPTAITTWYEISAIGSDTSITLTSSAGTISAGSAFVIEDLRVIHANTNATATNGGVFVTKGIRIESFTSIGTTIPAATTVDNIRAVYWLADANTVTNTTSCGAALEPFVDFTTQNLYVVDIATVAKIYKFNIRAALTLTAGKSTSAFTLVTGTQSVSGTVSQQNNGIIKTLGHGPGSGVSSLYFATTTRVYRVAVSNITSGSTTYQSDNMVEIPPGGTNSYAALSAMAYVEYDSVIDRLIIMNTSARSYVTQYNTTSAQFDRFFLVDTRQQDQSTADSGTIQVASPTGAFMCVMPFNGVYHIIRSGTTAALNQLYAIPGGTVDWTYAATTTNRLIFPAITTTTASKYYRLYVNSPDFLGSSIFGFAPEPYRVYYRTSGITDNSGSWTLLSATNNHDLTGVGVAASIQFMIEFRIFGDNAYPNRIYGLSLIYEATDNILSQYEWNLNDSDLTNGTVGFDQIATYGTTVPDVVIEYWNSSTNTMVLTQASTSNTNGQFQYWNGSAWTNGLGTGVDVIGTRRRFVPSAGIPANVNLFIKLRLAP